MYGLNLSIVMRVWDTWVYMREVNYELWIMGWYDLSMKIVWDDVWNWNDEFGMTWHETWKGWYQCGMVTIWDGVPYSGFENKELVWLGWEYEGDESWETVWDVCM